VPGEEEVSDNKQIKCCKCGRLTGTKFKELWYPDDPGAKLKCGKCGRWSTLADLGIIGMPLTHA
jgi:hypothetical protein